MYHRCIRCRQWAAALISAVVMFGCVSTPLVPTKTAAPGTQPSSAASGWWYARFRMDWPEQADPAWHMDLLIAHSIVQPSLERHQQDISLWRFHRRAARDTAGHQFSFIFYAPSGTAQRIFAETSAHPILTEAKACGRIIDFIGDDTETVSKPGIGDASDPNWTTLLRHAWPSYLMGASRMWLDLISGTISEDQKTEIVSDFQALENRYAKAGAAINALWQQEGRHAFLHHLNALFGYEPLVIIEKRHMRF